MPALIASLLAVLVLLTGCQSTPPKHGLTAAQIAALKEAGFHETDEGWEFGISDKVLFETDKFEIQAAAQDVITRVASTLIKVSISTVRVYGYTDSTGSDAHNDWLSQQRANAVANALVDAGMARDGLTPIGAGKRHPVADNSTAEGRAQNRRVAIVISTS
ncbi:Peptidoglycan-associated lipoprotein [Paraburkholderia humisilvae]|uniref:Peptidoglycan-associated lipoprotein n=2 Tax=Paraburkholderia humisilvae TaxID=627669 RepID=A0A6J5E6T4_9BURK|nr:Peptidoglycan-associated lipoprotein [Paraburkholderia humisilvae]